MSSSRPESHDLLSTMETWKEDRLTKHNTQEATLKHTIHADRRKETSTQRERETRTTCKQGRERDKRRD